MSCGSSLAIVIPDRFAFIYSQKQAPGTRKNIKYQSHKYVLSTTSITLDCAFVPKRATFSLALYGSFFVSFSPIIESLTQFGTSTIVQYIFTENLFGVEADYIRSKLRPSKFSFYVAFCKICKYSDTAPRLCFTNMLLQMEDTFIAVAHLCRFTQRSFWKC